MCIATQTVVLLLAVQQLDRSHTVQTDADTPRDAAALGSTVWGDPARYWPHGEVIFHIDPEVIARYTDTADSLVDRIHLAIAHWEAKTCIRFTQCTPPHCTLPYVHFHNGGGCRSFAGINFGEVNNISLASYCDLGTVIHEIGHAVGLGHEHSRNDRDTYIFVDLKQAGDRAYLFGKNGRMARDIGPYDYNSIMHYSHTDYTTTGHDTIVTPHTIGTTKVLSDLDAESVQFMYNSCEETYKKPICIASVRAPPEQSHVTIYTPAYRAAVSGTPEERRAYAKYHFNDSLFIEFNGQYDDDMTVTYIVTGGLPFQRLATNTANGDPVGRFGKVQVQLNLTDADMGYSFSVGVVFRGARKEGEVVGAAAECSVRFRVEKTQAEESSLLTPSMLLLACALSLL